jgi:release factor glutamine methyltransferase
MITLQEVLNRSIDYLEKKNLPHARRQAEEILSLSLKRPRIELYMHFDQPVEERELQVIRENLSRRSKREPLQYIEGKVQFYNAQFKVDSNVLIPRHETELLVDLIAGQLRNENLYGKVLWDLCTGSGCIGISLKRVFPELRVILSDFSQEALKKARENAELNGVEVETYFGDLFEAFNEPVDFLVSNPPYISTSELLTLEPEVIEYEPKMSLDGGLEGLDFYRRIEKELKNKLKNPGKAWFEIGANQKEPLQKLFCDKNSFQTKFEKDYAGHDRFFFLELE